MNKKIILIFTLTLAAFLMVGAVSAEGLFGFFNGSNGKVKRWNSIQMKSTAFGVNLQ